MSLSPDQVRHIAQLARLQLSDDEVKKFATQLTDILQYVDILGEADVANVEPTAQVTGLMNVMRDDVIRPAGEKCDKQSLLACTELPVERDQIRVKPALTG